MNELRTRRIQCPYCGEMIHILIDCSVSQQSYIEDCQVCCRPINLDVTMDPDGDPVLLVSDENE